MRRKPSQRSGSPSDGVACPPAAGMSKFRLRWRQTYSSTSAETCGVTHCDGVEVSLLEVSMGFVGLDGLSILTLQIFAGGSVDSRQFWALLGQFFVAADGRGQ